MKCLTEQIVNGFAARVGHVTDNFVAIGGPVRGFGKRQFAVDAQRVIDDQQFSVLIDPALPSEQVMDTRCHFIPGIVILVSGQADIDSTWNALQSTWNMISYDIMCESVAE